MTRGLRWLLVMLAAVLSAAVIAVDIATGVWQEVPLLSGLVSGVVTFLLTVVVVDTVVARRLHRQWAPLTRIALTDVLEVVTTDGVTPRTIGPDHAELDLGAVVRRERRELGEVLARWSAFLVSRAGVDAIVEQVAVVAAALDDVAEADRREGSRRGGEVDRLVGEVPRAVAVYDGAVARLADLVRQAQETELRGSSRR